jgi:hypothetical protein
MFITWPGSRCVVCLSSSRNLSKAHVLSAAVGGLLVVPCLCGDCNSRLGYSAEAKLKLDPAVRLAIESINDDSSAVAAMRDRQLFITEPGDLRVQVKREDGRFKILDSPQRDESRVKSPERARVEVETTLRRRGATQAKIEAARRRIEQAPVDIRTPVAPGVAIKKGRAANVLPNLNAQFAPDTCYLSIAYLFLALLLGKTIYDPALQPVRDALTGAHDSRAWTVEPFMTRRNYEPWHGLAFEVEQPDLTVHIRLFGRLAWLVHFTDVRAPAASKAPSYLLDLTTREEHWRLSQRSVDAQHTSRS